MPNNKVDLSDIQLPEDAAEKPAEIDNVNPAGDDNSDNKPDENAGEIQPTVPDDREGLTTNLGPSEGDSRDLPTEDPKPQEEKPTDKPAEGASGAAPVEKPEDKKEGEEKKETDTPEFHKHPDWIKREEKLRETETQLAFEKGKNEALATKDTSTPEKKEEVKSAARIAEETVRKQVADGLIDPKDQLELNRIYGEELEKELEKKEQIKIEAQKEQDKLVEEKRQEILTQVNDVYKEAGISDKKDQDKIADLASKWATEGTANWSIGTLKLAAEHLKAKGEVGKKADPTPKPVAPVTPPAPDANSRITKPTNESDPASPNAGKKSVDDLRHRNLDDVVADFSKTVG